MSLNYEQIFQNFRSLYRALTDIIFILPQEQDLEFSGPISELSIMSGSREFTDATFTENIFIVPGVVVDFASEMLRFEDRVMASEIGQFDSELYSVHINNSMCKIKEGDFAGKYCYKLSNHIIIEDERYLIVSTKQSKLLNQVRLVVRKKN
jgi:hypothetical protein